MSRHWAIFTTHESRTEPLITKMAAGHFPQPLAFCTGLRGFIFSHLTLETLMLEQERHDHNILNTDKRLLRSMSSGEQKRLLLHYIFAMAPDYIILDHPFDNLDRRAQDGLKTLLERTKDDIIYIQFLSRAEDVLPFITNYGQLIKDQIKAAATLPTRGETITSPDYQNLPKRIEAPYEGPELLVSFKKVSVSYGSQAIIKDISWNIAQGEFWELSGPNGSGKSTLITMIVGDNPKAYGTSLWLFGQKKGSGESVWDIKRQIGYFTPGMTHKYNGRHSIEEMLLSGFADAIGLYIAPSEAQRICVSEWLGFLGLTHKKDQLFQQLSQGDKRLVMTARAMVKHPPLLILDEPTVGMDDTHAALFTAMVNAFAAQSESAIVFVSHRTEPGLKPEKLLELCPSVSGSTGKTTTL